jgi:hypothetical protein
MIMTVNSSTTRDCIRKQKSLQFFAFAETPLKPEELQECEDHNLLSNTITRIFQCPLNVEDLV